MPEGLTCRKTAQSPGHAAGDRPETGPLQFGMVAGMASEYPAGFNRNLEASVRSRDTNGPSRTRRDVIEAGLN
jgi:hypothetical protein